MWALLAVFSAVLLGLYDVAKKKALQQNGVIAVLLVATALSTLFVSPFLSIGPAKDLLRLVLKAVLVTLSWISGMIGLKLLPLTTVSTIKGSRPVFVVLFSILLFGEKLNWMQWVGIAIVLAALWLLGRTSKKDGTVKARRTGFIFMGVSIVTGVASALYDKHIISGMEPMFVQSWTNLYITLVVGLYLLIVRALARRSSSGVSAFRWDWILLLTAVLITGADMAYFFALGSEGALLSVISIVRRCAVLVTFVFGALIFKEKNLRGKSFALLVLLAGMVCLMLAN